MRYLNGKEGLNCKTICGAHLSAAFSALSDLAQEAWERRNRLEKMHWSAGLELRAIEWAPERGNRRDAGGVARRHVVYGIADEHGFVCRVAQALQCDEN